jgi:hypothetical protein
MELVADDKAERELSASSSEDASASGRVSMSMSIAEASMTPGTSASSASAASESAHPATTSTVAQRRQEQKFWDDKVAHPQFLSPISASTSAPSAAACLEEWMYDPSSDRWSTQLVDMQHVQEYGRMAEQAIQEAKRTVLVARFLQGKLLQRLKAAYQRLPPTPQRPKESVYIRQWMPIDKSSESRVTSWVELCERYPKLLLE